jgi:hypothetical protein
VARAAVLRVRNDDEAGLLPDSCALDQYRLTEAHPGVEQSGNSLPLAARRADQTRDAALMALSSP